MPWASPRARPVCGSSHVNSALSLCGCSTAEHVAMWIAQVGHESAGLTRLVESLNHTPDALMAMRRRGTMRATAQAHGRTEIKASRSEGYRHVPSGGDCPATVKKHYWTVGRIGAVRSR